VTSFDDEWERCKPLLADALTDGWTLDAVEREIRAGRAILWPMKRSACVTQIHEYPNGRVLRIWLAGGELDELMLYLSSADSYARWQGCKAVELEGRPGWERVLTGYTKRRVVLTKEL
jgi:hypothetical protein